jgi:hypothetical protein
MLAPSLIALIRTFVPAVVGTVIAFFVGRGIEIDPATQETLTTGVVSLSIAVYYGAITALERKVDPRFGWLLGFAKAPAYVNAVDEQAIANEDPRDYEGYPDEDPALVDEWVDPAPDKE